METFFRIRYEFSKDAVLRRISETVSRQEAGYICVADGNVLSHVQHDRDYWRVVYHSMFSICDSGWVPLYLRLLYGIRRSQYCGAQIFKDIVSGGHYRMAFLGTDSTTLEALKNAIAPWNPCVREMTFTALPFRNAEEFDYPSIAGELNAQQVEVIWVALGAPKQEQFMNRLLPFLKRGVMLGVGAVFNYYSGCVKRAPRWLVACKLEFAYRLLAEPGKQIARCKGIISSLPLVFRMERERKLAVRLVNRLRTLENSYLNLEEAKIIPAFGQSPSQLDNLLAACASHPETRFTIVSDDARCWKLPPNVSVLPSANQH